jgi:SAM-dependent methyltransferase
MSSAIDVHTAQAAEFEERYRNLAADPYRSTFTYGRKKIEELIDRETAELRQGARVLDVGCGTGFNVRRLRDRGFSVVGLEPSPTMRERAQRDNPDSEILDGDIERLPFDDATFDFVLAIEVIRYLDGPDRALSEIRRVLKPGGLAIVTAAPRWSLNGYALLNVVTSRVQLHNFTKVKHSFMTERGARRAMERAGFGSFDVRGVFLGPWQALGRLSPSALAVTLRGLEAIEERLSDQWPFRNLTNHLVLIGRR